jgi:hypothetical protein
MSDITIRGESSSSFPSGCRNNKSQRAKNVYLRANP